MRYSISLIHVYLRSDQSGSCWDRDLWRFDSTEHALVVGIPMGPLQPGMAHVFGRNGGSWRRRHLLMASDGKAGNDFGYQVAVDANVIAATAPSGAGQQGASYVYRWDGLSWVEEQKLVAPEESEAAFGQSVDVCDGVMVVGGETVDGNGAAYVYRRLDTWWRVEQRLGRKDVVTGDEFAYALSMRDGEIVVGAPAADERGAAYVYRRMDGRWTQIQTLIGPDDGHGGDFGRHVGHTIDGHGLIVGGSRTGGNGMKHAVAHVFQATDDLWSLVAVLEPTPKAIDM